MIPRMEYFDDETAPRRVLSAAPPSARLAVSFARPRTSQRIQLRLHFVRIPKVEHHVPQVQRDARRPAVEQRDVPDRGVEPALPHYGRDADGGGPEQQPEGE